MMARPEPRVPLVLLAAGLLSLALPAAAMASGNAAAFISQSVPATMTTGTPATVSVTMQNTGSTTWLPDGSTPYFLGSQGPQDNTNWGTNRVPMDPGDSIAPGDAKTFLFEVVPPATPGTYVFQWEMIQAGPGAEWFGAFTSAVNVVVSLGPPRYLGPDGATLPAQQQHVLLRWSPVPAASSYELTLKDLTAGTTHTLSGVTALSRKAAVQAGHAYTWSVRAVSGAVTSATASASFSVHANVPDVTPPTVSIPSPAVGATVSGQILVSAVAADDVDLDRVELAVSGKPGHLTLTRPPHLFFLDTRKFVDGAHTLTATAFDAAGNSTAANVAVVVDNSEAAACIPPGGSGTDEVPINAALNADGAVALLCPSTVYHLQDAIQFTFPNQDLHTKGFPTDSTRAKLVVDGGATGGAIEGLHLSGLKVRNVEIDGNRGALAPLDGGEALIVMGGNGQDLLVASVKAYDPRSWSTVHLFEGDPDPALGCNRALVTFNDLGPAGHPNGEWADGISLACRNSRVTHNTITDATDGAIVVFASPGSRIQNNQVIASTQELLGGINMVDFGPFEGDYRGTVVAGNRISATGASIKVGLAMGLDVWTCVFDDAHRNVGARVANNVIDGDYMHYGFVANGVFDWTASGNVSNATHSGVPESVCGLPVPSAPAAFLKDALRAQGPLQPEFVDGQVDALLDVHN